MDGMKGPLLLLLRCSSCVQSLDKRLKSRQLPLLGAVQQ